MSDKEEMTDKSSKTDEENNREDDPDGSEAQGQSSDESGEGNNDSEDEVEITREDERPEETLDRLREESRQGGPPEKVQEQRERGQKTARERIEYLFDADSFREIDQLVEPRKGTYGEDDTIPPGDGVICGFGEIKGRTVACFSQDFTVKGGSLSEEHGRKICKLMDQAARYGVPLIGLNDSGGARIQEGVRSLASYAELFHRNTKYSGKIPQISVIMGPCAGGAVYSPAISDFVVMVEETSFMYVTGPDVVRTVTHEDLSHRDLGGVDVHRRESGVAHLVGEDDKDALDRVVRLLSYLPDNHEDFPVRTEPHPPDRSDSLKELVPEDKTKPYDVRHMIEAFVDGGSFQEIQPDYARNVVVGFARLDGWTVGLVANQPKFSAGTLDIDASDKAARFVRFCDSFNIPILTIEDVPGFMPGKEQESEGIIRHGAKLLYAYSEASVPLLTLITRKAYGGAYCVMASKHVGADFNFAWPMAEIAVMGPESAVQILHGSDIESAENPREELQEKLENYRQQFGNPWEAARRGYIDDVVKPEETRTRLIDSLEIALESRDYGDSPPPHGNIPL
ncbi:MAG: acyl-CoA carboxylase subunit beta [bacterium]